MTTLFDPLRVGEMELDNRIVMAPMTRSRASDDGVQPAYAAEYYRQRASAGRLVEVLRACPIREGAAGLFEACNHTKEAVGWRARPSPGERHTVQITSPSGRSYRSMAPPVPRTRPDFPQPRTLSA